MPPGHDMNYYFRGKIIKYSIKVLAEKIFEVLFVIQIRITHRSFIKSG